VKRTLVAATLTVVFVLALATPAFAMTHTADYEWDGSVDMERQVGHFCNTGAEQKVAISGEGKMERVSTATMAKGKLTVDEASDFVTAEDAAENLSVTSVIELCAPPKTEYTTTDYVYGDEVGWQDMVSDSGVVDTRDLFDGVDTSTLEEQLLALTEDPDERAEIIAADEDELKVMARDELDGNYDVTELDELTQQLWAVQVEANPGYSGNVHQEFEAAYGDTYAGTVDEAEELFTDQWGFTPAANHDGYAPVRGTDYVGNYFQIDQMARTSDGELKRFIDISEPFDGAYLMEDFEVTGEVDIEEAFNMVNVAAGEEVEVVWYDLF